MIIDRGHDWPEEMQKRLESYGRDMWLFRDDQSKSTTRARNTYRGDFRGFQYLTPRTRLTPKDLEGTKLSRPRMLHFICSPSRAAEIMAQVHDIDGWNPTTIYEPIPDRCVPEELPALISVLPFVSILSPNAEEALSVLSLPHPVTKSQIEAACSRFLDIGVGMDGNGSVIIRSGHLGAYFATREHGGRWIDAYWGTEDAHKVVDVTGAGNGFLGGLSAGLRWTGGNIFDAALYATVSASFIIEQEGLPEMVSAPGQDGLVSETWNHDCPKRRLQTLEKKYRNDNKS